MVTVADRNCQTEKAREKKRQRIFVLFPLACFSGNWSGRNLIRHGTVASVRNPRRNFGVRKIIAALFVLRKRFRPLPANDKSLSIRAEFRHP
jgi:hypothetical protein